MSHGRIIAVMVIAFLFLSALLTAGVHNKAHVKLLAVTESGNKTYGGSIADLYLDTQDGTGRVFIDTLPASKLDTQMSTRLARSIACKYVDADCSTRDFFYTIRANSAIVGGPSASAATAVVTAAVMKNLDLREDVAITGTISSGNLIGPVGGLKDKIEAAATNGIRAVLIPKGERVQKLEHNETIDLVDYGKTLNLTIIEVSTLDEAMQQFTGKSFESPNASISANPWYVQTMQMLGEKLCNRSSVLHMALNKALMMNADVAKKDFLLEEENARNLSVIGQDTFRKGDYYSSASYCFGSNVIFSRLILQTEEPDSATMRRKLNQTKENIISLNKEVSKREIGTITDLEAYMAVKDRLIEANEHLDKAEEELKDGPRKAYAEFAMANERFYSAVSWTEFFGKEGKRFTIDKKELEGSCMNKLSEVEEFYQYIDLIFPGALQDARKEMDKADVDKDRGNYELCLYKATIAKSEINMLSSLLGVTEDKLDELLDRKLEAARRAIAGQEKKDIFPILGYSYYEYARSLRSSNKYSALLYAEYALELSNLDVYFTGKKTFHLSVPREWLVIFLCGIIVGFIINDLVRLLTRKKEAGFGLKAKQRPRSRR